MYGRSDVGLKKCVPCVLLDASFGRRESCIFCKEPKQIVGGTVGYSCRSCTSGFPENPATKQAAEKAAADKVAFKNAVMEARLGQLEANMRRQHDETAKQTNDSLSRVDDVIVSLERSFGERMRALEDRLADLQRDVSDRMSKLEELSEARDANIQALLLRLLQGAGVSGT